MDRATRYFRRRLRLNDPVNAVRLNAVMVQIARELRALPVEDRAMLVDAARHIIVRHFGAPR